MIHNGGLAGGREGIQTDLSGLDAEKEGISHCVKTRSWCMLSSLSLFGRLFLLQFPPLLRGLWQRGPLIDDWESGFL